MYPDLRMLEEKKKQLEMIGQSYSLNSPELGCDLRLFHYTSLPTLFSMLETDTIWATATRFSNDSSEEQLLPTSSYLHEMGMRMDNFQFCLSHNGDSLSQWRGYCPDGGGAIELDLLSPCTYSVLHADFETSHDYEVLENAPFRVLYVPKGDGSLSKTIMEELRDIENNSGVSLKAYNLIPYFKNAAFKEEAEWRLLFENTANVFARCIRFRTLRNGAKVPYLVVKCGNVSKNHSRCAFDEKMFDSDQKLQEMWDSTEYVVIPQGNNQESVYYRMKERIDRYNRAQEKGEHKYLRIVCEGHLPVRKIILAPTYNRSRLKEEVQRFCASLYWLQDVEIVCSEIPYIPPSE